MHLLHILLLWHIFGPKCFIISLSGMGNFLFAGASMYIIYFGKLLKSSACLMKNVQSSFACRDRYRSQTGIKKSCPLLEGLKWNY